jgi:hypothetical protein
MTSIVDNPNCYVDLHVCGGRHDLRMACPWSTLVAVDVDEVHHQGALVDRRIQLVLLCGCRRDLSIPLTVPVPRIGEPARCWGRHQS